MKKRFLALSLMLVIVFALCACDSGSADSSIIIVGQDVQEHEEKLASINHCKMMLRLTINPQLVLYLDENGTVLKADADNEDGEKLLAALELVGLSYSDAVGAVLFGAEEQNVLTEKANVQIDVLSCADGPLTFEQTQLLARAVTDYNENLVPFVDQSAVVAASCGANLFEVEKWENGDVWYSYFSNMSLVREICYGADGSYREWGYDGKNTTDTIDIAPDGTRQEEHMAYYENGSLSLHIVRNPEGNYEEVAYFPNGNEKTRKVIHADGTVADESFYENGNPKARKEIHADGTVIEESFHENGTSKARKEVHADGTVIEESFHENGNPETSKVVYADGWIQERSFNENGICIYSKDVFPDGRIREQGCYENGNVKMWKEVAADGSTLLEEYNADGSRIYSLRTYANGDWEKQYDYPGGNPKCREGSTGGEYYIYNYDENGNLIE